MSKVAGGSGRRTGGGMGLEDIGGGGDPGSYEGSITLHTMDQIISQLYIMNILYSKILQFFENIFVSTAMYKIDIKCTTKILLLNKKKV